MFDGLAHSGGPFHGSLPQEDHVMRQFDFAPLYRSTVGFDSLLSMLDSAAGAPAETSPYPPYNIERLGENSYRISMAVAGFSPADLKIEVKEGLLSVKGEKSEDAKAREFLHRGIAARSFERRFQLADFVEVKGADVRDGMLHVDLVREVPEKMKPRTIAIGSPAKAPEKVIEHKQAA
jgi:molecular chaperone IbpA